jgi:hypothetical protein
MKKCFHPALVVEGYGITECGSVTMNDAIIPGVDYMLKDLPELGYFSKSDPPKGEICVKTKAMFAGYFGDPDATAAAFADGYYRTGDIGKEYYDVAGELHVKIIGRIKNVTKMAGGEFVAPESIESILMTSVYVSQILVDARGTANTVTALVVMPHTVLTDGLEAEVLRDLRRIAIAAKLPAAEVPAAVRLLLTEDSWTATNGMMTASNKMDRKAIKQRYSALLDSMQPGSSGGNDGGTTSLGGGGAATTADSVVGASSHKAMTNSATTVKATIVNIVCSALPGVEPAQIFSADAPLSMADVRHPFSSDTLVALEAAIIGYRARYPHVCDPICVYSYQQSCPSVWPLGNSYNRTSQHTTAGWW